VIHLGVAAAHHNVDVQDVEQVARDFPWCTNNDFVNIFARQNIHHTFMEIHNWVVAALVDVDRLIVVNADIQKGSFLLGTSQRLNVAHMEQIKRSINVDNTVVRFGHTVVGELGDSPSGRQEVGNARSRGRSFGGLLNLNVEVRLFP